MTLVPFSGYVYLVFESDKSVRALLQDCTEDLLHPEGYSEYYFKMSSRRMRCKDVSLSHFLTCADGLGSACWGLLTVVPKKVTVWVNNAC